MHQYIVIIYSPHHVFLISIVLPCKFAWCFPLIILYSSNYIFYPKNAGWLQIDIVSFVHFYRVNHLKLFFKKKNWAFFARKRTCDAFASALVAEYNSPLMMPMLMLRILMILMSRMILVCLCR
ncbi:hypothetical protein HanIR_Chr15g0755531 [Helianthus annuus]|nr:hypothetical protein HanIR_Chr15g0755531 [Helianthus annuus]